MTEVVTRSRHSYQVVERWMFGDAAAVYEYKTLRDLAQQFDLPRLLRVQADEQQAVAPAQLVERTAA